MRTIDTFRSFEEAVRSAVRDVEESGDGSVVYICRGPGAGCSCSASDNPCNDCYVIGVRDGRTIEEHLAHLIKGDA